MKSIYTMKLEHLFRLWDHYECEKYLRYFTDKNNKFAIYGAGVYGIRIASMLKEHFGTVPVAFIDQKAENGIYHVGDVPVYSPYELFDRTGNIPVGVALKTFFTGESTKEVSESLRLAGFDSVRNILMPDAYMNEFLYYQHIDRKKVMDIIDVLHDYASKEQYYTYIYSLVWKTPFFAPAVSASSNYCETNLFWLDEKDHVLDCGAFDGDTVRQIMANYPDLHHITMFEPDAALYDSLTRMMQEYPTKACN